MKKLLLLGMCWAALNSANLAESAKGRESEKIEKLIAAVDDPDRNVVLSAMKKLGNYGRAARGAVPALARRFRETDKEIGNQAGRAMAQIGSAAVPEVTAALKEGSPAIRTRALLTFTTMGREAGAAVLTVRDLLAHPEPKVRLLAALALGAMHDKARPAAEYLGRALRDPDRQVRFVAADALYRIGPETVGLVVAAARDRDFDVRINALATLSQFLNSPEAFKALADALEDPDGRIQSTAAGSLIRLGTLAAPAAEKLLQILDRGGVADLETQVRAFTAVLAVTRPDDLKLRDAITGLNARSRWSRAGLPGSYGNDPRKTAKTLAAFLSSSDATERLAAALALGRIKTVAKEHLVSLQKCASDPNRSVRCAALLALALADANASPVASAPGARLDESSLVSRPSPLAPQIDAAVENCKGASDPADLVRLHILLSVIPSHLSSRGARLSTDNVKFREVLEQGRSWVCRSLNEQSFAAEDLPGLVHAINLTAQLHLGFTEPFSRLAFKLQNVVQRSKEPVRAIIAFDRLGKGVPPDSVYWPAIQHQWTRILSKVPIELFVLEKSQKIGQIQQVSTAINQQQQNQQQWLTISRRQAAGLPGLMNDYG